MANSHKLSKIGACVVCLVLGQYCAAQSEMALFTQTGLATEEGFRWAQQPKMLNERQMQMAFEHLRLYSVTDTSTSGSPFSFNPWGGLEYNFDLVESLIPGFHESTYSIGNGLRLSSRPSLHGKAIFHEAPYRQDHASLVGFRSIETLQYSKDKGLTKTVHRILPIENAFSQPHGVDGLSSMVSAIGHCDCAPSSKPFRNKHIRFQEDVVINVPFKALGAEPETRKGFWNADMAQDMAYINLVRDILGDVGRGHWTAVKYSVPYGDIPTQKEREETPFTMNLYDDFGEVIGTKDTVFVTPRMGDEFGDVLSQKELREAVIDPRFLYEYNDFGEPVGSIDVGSNISVNDIAGMRFYETWIFLEGEPCPRKRVNRVVFLREGLDDDGNYIGYRPMPFAIVLR